LFYNYQLIIYGFQRTCVDVTGAYLYQEYPFEQPLAVTLQSEVCDILGIAKEMSDAGKAYYIAFSNHIVENGYTKSLLDPCLFYKIHNDNVKDIILICIHVDDIIYLFSSDINYIHEFNQKLE
jgi:hypothetical protein